MGSPRMTDSVRGPRSGRMTAVWNRLLGPVDEGHDIYTAYNSRLLSIVLAVMVVAFAIVDTVQFVSLPQYQVPWYGYILAATAFLLNRYGAYRPAAILACLMFPLVIFSHSQLSTPEEAVQSLNYFVVGIMMATILLRKRETGIFVLGCLGGILSLPWVSPGRVPDYAALVTPLSVNMFGAVLAMTFRVHRDALEERRQAVLRESESKYRLLVEGTHDWLWELNAEGRYTYVSPQVERILGYHPGHMGGKSPIEFVPPNEAEEAKRVFRDAIRGHLPIEGHKRQTLHRDGSVLVLETNATPILDEHGGFLGYRGIDRDVTARERAEVQLRREVQFSSGIIDSASEGICVCHNVPDYPYVEFSVWNEQMARITGYTMEQINRLGWYQTMYPNLDTQQQAIERMTRMREGENLEAEEWTVTRADRQPRTLSISTRVLRTDAGVAHVLAVMQDITDRRRAEQQAETYRQRLETVLKAVPLPLFAKHRDGRYFLFNPAFEKYFGMSERDLVGKTAQEIWPATDAEVYRSRDDELYATGGVQVYEHRLCDTTGESREVIFTTACLHDTHGEIVGLVGTITDVTDLKQAEEALRKNEERLRQAEKMEAIGLLAGGVAHDFNNQLAGILGYAEMVRQGAGASETLARYAEMIMNAAQRSAHLTRQLLCFARKGRLQRVPVDLHVSVSDVMALLKHSIDKRIVLRERLEASVSQTIGDPAQLQNVLLNVAINARDAMPEGGELVFSTSLAEVDEWHTTPAGFVVEPGRYICVSIADSGVGMDADTLRRAFEPFFTTKEPGKGTGLGLAAVYGIIKSHQGFIEVDSEPARGTTFRLYLPVAQFPQEDTEAAPVAPCQGRPLRVLVVDDEKAVAGMAAVMLSRMGHVVSVVTDSEEAVRLYRDQCAEIDLVILDVVMPKLTGRQVLRELRAANPRIRVLLSSGYDLDGEAHELVGESTVGFIQKPFTTVALTLKIEEIMGHM